MAYLCNFLSLHCYYMGGGGGGGGRSLIDHSYDIPKSRLGVGSYDISIEISVRMGGLTIIDMNSQNHCCIGFAS